MPVHDSCKPGGVHDSCKPGGVHSAYFLSLEELDGWAAGPSEPLTGVLRYQERRAFSSSLGNGGKLLVCHDFKGGYSETPFALSYTFNYWSYVDVFVYFSHHRVTVPPPGWISAAHRQGVKILGTLIFEHSSSEEDGIRLLLGKLSKSSTGPALPTTMNSIPLSPHYARLLARLARDRCFDGYLLNFEWPLGGKSQQAKALVAWIALLKQELQAAVGSHALVIWYDSILYTGSLKWQDRLNAFNLPFFLSSDAFFTNYTWPLHYPHVNAQYFLSVDQTLWGDDSDYTDSVCHPPKSLQDIYVGVDFWGRGSHGGGGYGSYKAISAIDPQSIGLSVALFGQGWTWESKQDRPGWTWQSWWNDEKKIWAGPSKTEVVVVQECPQDEDIPPCSHGPFQSISSFFARKPPPNPSALAFHTTFGPGVGRSWYVDGRQVWQSVDGWTDIDKQCSMGNMVWPSPAATWEGGEWVDDLPDISPIVCLDDSWNGGSCLQLDISSPCFTGEDDNFRCAWLPIQSLTVTAGRRYQAMVVYKFDSITQVDLDVGLTLKVLSPPSDYEVHITNIHCEHDLPGGWARLKIQFSLTSPSVSFPVIKPIESDIQIAIGLIVGVALEKPRDGFHASLYLGQLNVFILNPQDAMVYNSSLIWADFTPSSTVTESQRFSGILTWETAITFDTSTNDIVTSPEDPVPVWKLNTVDGWYPAYAYFNIYIQAFTSDGHVEGPEKATWNGTSGLDGNDRSFVVDVPVPLSTDGTPVTQVRLYVQGMSDHGEILPWSRCVFVDVRI